VDPETAPVVIRIFNEIDDGVPLRQIARELEQEGIPTPFQILEARGQLPEGRTASPIWRRSQIQRMMHDPSYWGEHSAYRSKNTSEKVRSPSTGVVRKVRRRTERAMDDPDRVALPDTCPALVSKELAERVAMQLEKNKENNPGRLTDPLETIWRGLAICGHCGRRMFTSPAPNGHGRRYNCGSRRGRNTDAVRAICPGGAFSIAAKVLDPSAWDDVRAWLHDEDNVRRLLAEWEQEERSVESSAMTRLEVVMANIKELRENMDNLTDSIAEQNSRGARQSLQEKLELRADQLRKEEVKRERLMAEASAAVDYAKDARDIREWVSTVAAHADNFTPLEKVTALRALGAQVTVWNKDHIHEDGRPQRYEITLQFTGFTGQPVTLPASRTVKHDSDNLSCGQPFAASVAASSESAWMIE
jgi:site-specific DNA recombinase